MPERTPNCANKRPSSFAASNPSVLNSKMAMNAEMLNSWKEIAVYLGRGIRTVQRWEIDLGLPVRRPRGKPRSAVIALKAELDSWLTGSMKEIAPQEIIKKPFARTPRAQILHSNRELLVSTTKQIMERSVGLCEKSHHLCEQLNRVLALTARLAMKRPTPPPMIAQHTKAAGTNS